MLIQITNRCRMGCPHCLDDSTPDGGMMSDKVFRRTVEFAKRNQALHVVLSGGEPTEHPRLLGFALMCSDIDLPFSVCSNGMWLGDAKTEGIIERISRLRGFVGGQIYSNPKWYRLHDETVAKYTADEGRWKSLNWFLDTEEIKGMQNIGRARNCPEAVAEAEASPYHNSCLAAIVTAVQTANLPMFFALMLHQRRFCTPLVDWRGDFHMSESWLCPSIGNIVKDDADAIWAKMRMFRPCGGCIGCKKYLTEVSYKMAEARRLLGQ